jgi:hypothetical protein
MDLPVASVDVPSSPFLAEVVIENGESRRLVAEKATSARLAIPA